MLKPSPSARPESQNVHIPLRSTSYVPGSTSDSRVDQFLTETDINETGNIGMKNETRGNRDEWRGVRDVMEIGWTLEWKRYSRG